MFTPSVSKAAALSLALTVFSNSVSARPANYYYRRDGGDASMSAAFSSMFAAGAKEAAEHADGSTSDNLIIEKFLWSLNNLRYQHDAPPVYWNTTLWEYATNWASKCPSSHSFGPYGETMGSGAQQAQYDMNSFGEEAAWNGQVITTDDEFLKSGHFFTEVWKATRYIGCARVWCDNDDTGKPINNWISVCEYEFNGAIEGFAGNVSRRCNEGPPKDWDPPQNHVSFTSFPPINSPAKSWPATVSSAGITLADLPQNVIASATASHYGLLPTGTTDSDTNPVVGPTKIPGPGAIPSGSQAVPTRGSGVIPSGPDASTGASAQSQPKQTATSVAAGSNSIAGIQVTSAPPASTFAHQGNPEQPASPPIDSSSEGGDNGQAAVTVYKTVTVSQ